MSFVLIIAGLVLLIGGAEILVKGASRLAGAMGISSLVIGLTVVAFGTSAPELAVSMAAGLNGQADIALGNVLGSNIFNVLFILGLSALIIPLRVDTQLVRLDMPIMIGAALLGWWFAADGVLVLFEGVILCSGIIAYTAFLYFKSKADRLLLDGERTKAVPMRHVGAKALATSFGYVVIGLVLLVYGSRLLVDGAVDLARSLGVDELIISLTIVAAGTSMPEVFTSVVAALRGQRDIAVGNVVGSNIFNILMVLGATTIVSGSVGVSPQVQHFDLPVMVLVMLVCLPIFFTRGEISRWEGGLLFFYYLAYTGYLVFVALQHPAIGLFDTLVLWIAVPLTVVALGWSALHSLRVKN